MQGQGLYDFSRQRSNQPEPSSLSAAEEQKGEETPKLASSSSGDSIGSFENEDQEGSNIKPQNGPGNDYIDEAYEYDDFFSGLQNEMMHQSANTGVQKEGKSQIQPSSSQDIFGDQLEGDGMLDSTKGMRNMITAMKQGESAES